MTYAKFWDFYLAEHSRPWTRRIHIASTILGLSFAVSALILGLRSWVLLALLIGYGPAWLSHFFIEKNRPATWKHPWWSFLSDLRMIYWTLRRRDFPVSFESSARRG